MESGAGQWPGQVGKVCDRMLDGFENQSVGTTQSNSAVTKRRETANRKNIKITKKWLKSAQFVEMIYRSITFRATK